MVAKNLKDFRLLHVESKCAHSDLELVIVDTSILVCIEEFKRFLDLLFLLISELRPRMRTPFSLLYCG